MQVGRGRPAFQIHAVADRVPQPGRQLSRAGPLPAYAVAITADRS
jgi:hypothetical protein